MKEIKTPHDLKNELKPFKLYSMKELRKLIKDSHKGKELGNIKIGSILTRALPLLESDGFNNYYKKE